MPLSKGNLLFSTLARRTLFPNKTLFRIHLACLVMLQSEGFAPVMLSKGVLLTAIMLPYVWDENTSTILAFSKNVAPLENVGAILSAKGTALSGSTGAVLTHIIGRVSALSKMITPM